VAVDAVVRVTQHVCYSSSVVDIFRLFSRILQVGRPWVWRAGGWVGICLASQRLCACLEEECGAGPLSVRIVLVISCKGEGGREDRSYVQ